MIKLGIIGSGRWSKVICSKFEQEVFSDCKIVFIADSKSDIPKLLADNQIDWALVATPPETHFQLVKLLLESSVNVFCEKPLTSSLFDIEELYSIADRQDKRLYVDDVFLWRHDINAFIANATGLEKITALFFKQSDFKVSPQKLIDDLAFHHFYVLARLFDFDTFLLKSVEVKNNILTVQLETTSCSVSLAYSKASQERIHKLNELDLTTQSNDALAEMIRKVIDEEADFTLNKRVILWASQLSIAVKQSIMPSVGVVGGGIFGSMAAIMLAQEGCKVTLYEKEKDILLRATRMNQLRIHRGYHYPRSLETALECKLSAPIFRAYFPEAVSTMPVRHMYAIAAHGSKTSPSEYEKFMDKAGLSYSRLSDIDNFYSMTNKDKFASIYVVEEDTYDPVILQALCRKKLEENGVTIELESAVVPAKLKEDAVVTATYSKVFDENAHYQFEVCEKPIVRLPPEYQNTSLVIMDGPFMCFDPLPDTDLHLLGHVVHAIHHTSFGSKPTIPDKLKEYVDKGHVTSPRITNFSKFKETMLEFFPGAQPIEHIGSYFLIRTVLANRDHDDARPTIVKKVKDNYYEVFSGKVTVAPKAAQKIVQEMLYPSA